MTTTGVDVVLFDLGGVLVELSGVGTFSEWMGNGVSHEEVWRRWLRSPAVRAFESGRIEAQPFADQLIAEFELRVDRDTLLMAFSGWPRGLFPGAADLVRGVRRHHVCATLSNTNALHWQRFIGEMQLDDLFDRHFASHLTGKLKPDQDVFEHVLASLACDPVRVVFVDDQPLNVEAARRAGMTAVLARGVEQAGQALAAAGVRGAAGQ
jgi:FMN phosphatase YigB (HAD superfamily)